MKTLGILQADKVSPELAAVHGDYPEMFARLLAAHGTRFKTWCAVDGELPDSAAEADAFVITGSRCSVYDDLPWIETLARRVNELIDDGAVVIGVCFGHQLIAHFRGGRTGPADVGWGVGVHRVDLVATEAWMQPPAQTLSLLASHADQVLALPPGATRLAGSAFCPNAMYRIGETVLCVQQHPEFTPQYAQDLMAIRRSRIDPLVYAAAADTFGDPTSDGVFASWVHGFVDAQR